MGTYVRKAKSLNFSKKGNRAAPDAADMSRYTITIGRFFKRKRSKINLSLRDVAKEIDVSNSTLSRYETSMIDMPLSVLIKLCRFYGCRLGECVADADGLIAAENIEVLAQKASKDKADKLFNQRKARHDTKQSVNNDRQAWEYVCDIANAGAKILDKIERMNIPAKYRVAMEIELSDCVLEIIEAKAGSDTLPRHLEAYVEMLKNHLHKNNESSIIKP